LAGNACAGGHVNAPLAGATLDAPGEGVAITTTVNFGNADDADDAATEDDALDGAGWVAAADDCGTGAGCALLHAASTITSIVIHPYKIKRRFKATSCCIARKFHLR